MTVALATSQELKNLHFDDQHLLKALTDAGVNAMPVVWSDPKVDWGQFDCCVIRSTWDYSGRVEEYLAWARMVSQIIPLHNLVEIIEWNCDKRYLQELAKKGIAVVPSRFYDAGHKPEWRPLLNQPGWHEVVVKPCVSASSYDTYRVNVVKFCELEGELDRLFATRPMMIQPYMTTVETQGEVSLFFIQGKFTHAIVKRPKPGDFRVQEEYGGSIKGFKPPGPWRDLAREILDMTGKPLLYARVDLMVDDAGCALLSELELIEPSMYLRFGPECLTAFVSAIQGLR